MTAVGRLREAAVRRFTTGSGTMSRQTAAESIKLANATKRNGQIEEEVAILQPAWKMLAKDFPDPKVCTR